MRPVLLCLALLATPALAIGTEEAPGASTGAAQALIDAGDFEGALGLLEPIVASDPGNADALNLAAYARRNLGDLAEAGRLYEAALGADPDHLGALEYQGELFLQQGDRVRAEANLARLTELCGDCGEREDLAEALAGS
jgi:tetratricopeptide (TPR) repeat protein